jgi:hypothetical protein
MYLVDVHEIIVMTHRMGKTAWTDLVLIGFVVVTYAKSKEHNRHSHGHSNVSALLFGGL